MKSRVVWKMFVLTIVKIGLYRLYWFIKTRREIMNLHPEIKILSPAFLIIPVVIMIAAVAVFIISIINAPTSKNCPSGSIYSSSASSNLANNLNSNSNNCQASTGETVGILALYLGIFLAYIFFVIWEWSYSHGVEAVTGGKLSFAMSLVVLILVPDGIDILIVQD